MPFNTLVKPIIEYRSMPALVEQRNNLLDEMDGLLKKAKEETRALSDNAGKRFEEIKVEVAKIDKTLVAEEEARSLDKKKPLTMTDEEKRSKEIETEERAFVELVKEGRAANLPAGTNGSVIPTSIANKIIDKVKNLSPVLSKATIWNVKGDLVIPVYDYTQHTTAYQGAEFTAITASAGVFTNVTLKAFVIGSLALISKSLINRSDVDILPFIINEIAKSLADFLEKELVAGAGGADKMKGLAQNTVLYNGNTTQVIDAAELVRMKMKVPQVYQTDAAWTMHPDTLAYIQTIKDSTGKFLMGNDLSKDGGFVLLNKPVYLSDNMPVYTTVGAKSIHYGDLSGLHVKFTQGVEMQVLLEKYSDQYAVGCVAWAEVDSAIAEPQKLITYVSK
jgi:HK97 family phage major capsid protein